ncbi:MAG: hypothetical protein IRZ16_04285 [Myxococcaceae bacterium]|nr:hypothetical protein [Myxococcaceae bacterium]
MTLDFTCQKCEGTFELEADDLIDGTEKLVCPHCDNTASAAMVDDFTSAITELRTQIAKLAKKFQVSMTIETEDVEEELEDEDEEDDEDEDDLDLDDEDEDEEDDYEDEDLEDDR